MIRIMIADDQTLMRDGLLTILGLQDDMHVVGLAKDGEEAFRMAQALAPQLVLMDIRMPVMNGIECTKRIKAELPDTVILILTTFDDDDYIIDALAGGAAGFLLKDIPGEKLAQAIRDAVKGEFLLPSRIAAKLASRLSGANAAAQALKGVARVRTEGVKLSDKESAVARLMLENRTNREIAGTLYMSEGTVKNYVSSIYGKIGTNDRTLAVMTLKDLLGVES
ncbi:response regulator transcription factor [Paenibacillus flagellatus]|uniref:response regulator transcription factor n=1 Tax=Paenibacillus flagellatus TaxID=2211139 RepID=UPI001FE90D5D|nr:response regulator transcription factor [Paenibacillus flagellatus]